MNLFDIDVSILKILNKPFSPYLNLLFLFMIYSVYGYLVLLLYIYFKKSQRKRIIHLILTVIIGTLFVNFLKFFIGRPRPYETFEEINKILIRSDPSFPSAHVFTSFMCLYFLPTKMSKLFRIFSLVYLIILIPIGSVYVGAHYPSDVVVGAIIGLLLPKIISEEIANNLFQKIFK